LRQSDVFARALPQMSLLNSISLSVGRAPSSAPDPWSGQAGFDQRAGEPSNFEKKSSHIPPPIRWIPLQPRLGYSLDH